MKLSGTTASEIYECVREGVQTGSLQPGDSLPPVRELAEALGVNRNTVAAAYQRLVKVGIALTQGRHGTSICEPSHAGEQEGLNLDTALIDLADGNPDPDLLLDISRFTVSPWPRPYLYGDQTVLPELQKWGHEWFAPDCPPEFELELTHGAVDAIERLAAAQLVAGDKVVVEQPCFLGTINALRLAGMHAVGVPIDEDGMLPDALDMALKNGAQALLITPRAHNPSGCSLSVSRAEQIQRILEKYPNVLVIVDDHFALLAETPYHSVIPVSSGRWALIRSVSKALGPDLRLGFLACDVGTAQRLRSRLAPGMTWVSHILQVIMSRSLNDPSTFEMLELSRKRYAERRNRLRSLLSQNNIPSFPSSDGFNVWIPLEKDMRDVAFELAKRGWLVRLGSAFAVQSSPLAIRVTVSKLTDDLASAFVLDLKASL
ncbi:transcriptional regulator PtsJ [Pantoea sp. Ap-967]|uniref:MocR-like B6 salvage transcription factor PtsJ n=1 Tax=Pantoea sp. Ap-967 TaxID=2608362 RepID=UPI00141E0742|nr:transcriptional regulator PtsJ [Pantoea sp. Ap-967]